MKRIDILVSFSQDVENERSVAERLIRSIAAELGVSVSFSYSNWPRGLKQKDEITGSSANGDDEGPLLLGPYFWEYQDGTEQGYPDPIPKTDKYDLVVWILWSGLGIKLAQAFVTSDGSRSSSAIDTELARALNRSKRTSGFPTLHVYRNRATPATPLQPKEKREIFCRQWDSVQEFFAAWEKNGGTEFPECCHDYQDLDEFETLFRTHFRAFLAKQLDGTESVGHKADDWEANPFRGLRAFDFEHAAIYYGRTKAVSEVLDTLKKQSTAEKRFVLVFGPAASGKSSLVRAGVLPLLTQGGTSVGYGPWRRAVTRPAAGGTTRDPFDSLAAALLAKFALPELQDAVSPSEGRNLASQLRKDPDGAATRVTEVLDGLARHQLDHSLDERESERLSAPGSERAGAIRPNNLRRIEPKMQLALIVDQLEELFASGFSPVLQRKYIAALGALAKCEGVFIIATLRSDFYAQYQQFPELVELTASNGRYELQPPTSREIEKMIRLPADAIGLRFEQDSETSISLDRALSEAAMASPDPLPSLEHLLSQLYLRQLERKDGLLRWSDYRALGELQGALANHAETVFLTLKREEQRALRLLIRHLATVGRSEEAILNRRTVPYSDLITSPGLDQQQKSAVKGLVDRLIKEGFLIADTDSKQELLVTVPQEVLLRRWPGVWQWLSEGRNFFRMRDRLDASLELWLSRGRQTDDLLDAGISLAEAETLVRDFGASLSGTQIDYVQKSLARQKRRLGMRSKLASIAAIAGLAIFAATAAVEWFNTGTGRNGEQELQQARENAALEMSQRAALATQLKKAEEKAQIAQQSADLATSQLSGLETQLKKAQEEIQRAQQSADLTTRHRSDLETQLKNAQEKAQLAQQNADLATSQRSALETQLKKTQEDVRQAQKRADLAVDEPKSGQTQSLNPAQNSLTSPQPLGSSIQSTRP
jgi:hypothetical protein